MVYTIIVVLLVLWLLGFSMSVGGNLIHALLFVAAVVLLYNFLQRRGRWV
jgi:NADH:ubiquinone oxidoreductase subunit 3 (subunit A)